MKDIKEEHVPYYGLRYAKNRMANIKISKLKQLLEEAVALGATHMNWNDLGVLYLREETDEEYQHRMEAKAERIRAHQKEEYELYLRLKEKYEASF